jgi:exopolyphosphatase/pppGpp-phosphohydrolase
LARTARLLVASVGDDDDVTQLRRERHYLRLGDDVHSLGLIGPRKLKEAGQVAKRFARIARKSGAEHAETIVTAPGRQAANGEELVAVLSEATQAPVIVLTREVEGRLAWEGAVARMEDPPEVVAVVDLGGVLRAGRRNAEARCHLGAIGRRGRASRDARLPGR